MKLVRLQFILCIIILALCVWYAFASGKNFENPGLCSLSPDGKAGCTTVYNSPYGRLLGFPNAYLGIMGFSILLAVLAYHTHNPSTVTSSALHTMIAAAALLTLRFLYIQYFVLEMVCGYCLAIDAAVLALAAVHLLSVWQISTQKR